MRWTFSLSVNSSLPFKLFALFRCTPRALFSNSPSPLPLFWATVQGKPCGQLTRRNHFSSELWGSTAGACRTLRRSLGLHAQMNDALAGRERGSASSQCSRLLRQLRRPYAIETSCSSDLRFCALYFIEFFFLTLARRHPYLLARALHSGAISIRIRLCS